MYKICLAFFLLTVFQLHSQQFPSEKQADAFIAALQKQEVNTICSLKRGSENWINWSTREDCKGNEPDTYVFWKQNGKTFLTLKDNCTAAPVIQIYNDDFWDFYFTNQNSIASEKIKWPEYIITDDKGEHKYSMWRSHDSFDEIILYTDDKSETLDKLLEYYFLQEIENGGKYYKNLNYESNKNSYTNQFRNKLNSLISKNQKAFEAKK